MAVSLRRLAAATLLVPLLTAAAVVTGSSPACACSCLLVTPAEAFRKADAVFVGHVVDWQPEHGFPISSSGDKAVVTFEVRDVYKGRVTARQEIVTAANGASCGLEFHGSGPFAVYVESKSHDPGLAPEKGQYFGSLCGGTSTLTEEVRSDLEQRPNSAPVASVGPTGPEAPGGAGAYSVLAWLAGIGVLVAGLLRWISSH
jgi:hypothetical protein